MLRLQGQLDERYTSADPEDLEKRIAAAKTALGDRVFIDPLTCPCSTMFRIDATHLCSVLENVLHGEAVNQITVDHVATEWARVEFQRMVELV